MFVDLIVLHCSATPNGKSFRASDIDRWHRKQGWSSLGYHYVIGVDGLVEAGRSESTPGAHAKGLNHRSIGICMIGTDEYSEEQWRSLEDLVFVELMSRYPQAKIVGHNEYSRKICPGFNVQEWVRETLSRE